jgi:hypothetical protein
LYLFFNGLFGQANGTIGRDSLVIGGNFLWTMLLAPFFMPVLMVIRDATIGSRERI